MSSRTSEEDEALSAALGWPGGISEPLLDRAALLRLVATVTAELASMRRCLDAADRERSELRADAERYRWLRNQKNAYHDAWNYFSPSGSAAEMDAVIDAAILSARETPRAAAVLQKPLD